MMGNVIHEDPAGSVSEAAYQAVTQHIDSQGGNALLSRSATLVVAASDASANSKAGADYVCDGIADDVEIQAAVGALAIGGKTLLSEGTFTTTAAINFGVSNVVLEGQGASTVVKAGAAIDLFTCTAGINNVTIKNLKLDGNAIGTRGINFSQIDDLRVESIEVDDFATDGIRLAGTPNRRIWIESCHFNKTPIQIRLAPTGAGHRQYRILNNAFNAWTTYAISLEGAPPGDLDSIHLVGNVFQLDTAATASNAINMSTDIWLVVEKFITNNLFHHTSPGTADGSWVDVYGSHIFLLSNVIDSSGFHAAIIGKAGKANGEGYIAFNNFVNTCRKTQGQAILMTECDWMRIIGNHFNLGVGKTDKGIYMDTCNYCTIEGNIVAGITTGIAGAIELADTTECQIIGNLCRNNSGYGVLESGTANYNTVQSNSLRNNTTGALSVSGANTKVMDNIGYVTENSGTATVANGQTTVTVTHGLATTPTRVQATPTLLSNAASFWVTAKGATTFVINVNADPGAGTAAFDWRAVVGEGN